MFKSTVKLNKDLMQRIVRCSEAAGYSSPEEFVIHVLERELSKIEEAGWAIWTLLMLEVWGRSVLRAPSAAGPQLPVDLPETPRVA